MRFDSYFELTKVIMGLCMIGYATPFIDYREDMNSKGLKHIHLYRVDLLIQEKDIVFSFKENANEVYRIELRKR